MKKYNIEVINKEVKADDEFDADTIILATGSKQIVPPIKELIKNLFYKQKIY